MEYQYSYLIGDIILLAIWIILFLWRKDVRKEMLFLSLFFGVIGIAFAFIHTFDWWHPLRITNTQIGIEDFILGFVTVGVASVIYEEIFKKRIRIRKFKNKVRENKNFIIIFLLLVVLFFGSFFILELNSFYSSIIAIGIPILIIWIKRRDLIIDSLVSGFLILITSIFVFLTIDFFTPAWIESAWYLDNLSGIIILRAPLEDLIWFFLIGTLFGPLYEYWKEGRLVNYKEKKKKR